MVEKFKRPIQAMAGVTTLDGSPLGGAGGNDQPFTTPQGTITIENDAWQAKKVTITLTNAAVTVGDATFHGELQIASVASGERKYVVSANSNYTNITLSGGFDGSEGFTLALGRIQNPNTALSGLEEAYVDSNGGSLTGSGLTGRAYQNSSWDSTTDDLPGPVGSTNSGIWINVLAVTAGGTDGIMTINTGTITMVYIETA